MTPPAKPRTETAAWLNGKVLLVAAMILVTAVYWSGLYGGWLFDDYPNIVDNSALKIHNLSIPDLMNAALSSPSSDFKRPLSSLTFGLNYLVSGMDPFAMKLTNLVIHLINGLLVFILTILLLRNQPGAGASDHTEPKIRQRMGVIAAVVASAWMLLPINLTGVLYTVQRMESLANVFVLAGLAGYILGREQMRHGGGKAGLLLAATSLVLGAGIGVLAKETAVMLPLYAFLVEWVMFRGIRLDGIAQTTEPSQDRRIWALFGVTLVLPMILGLIWLLPQVLHGNAWSTRDFTLGQRLLSEARFVVDYIQWTLLPTPHDLSFYHDNVRVSTGLLHPWTTLASLLLLASIVAAVFRLRRSAPLVALGLSLFLGCHLLTATIIPLELIFEHRNYFASFGIMLAVVPWLMSGRLQQVGKKPTFHLWRLARNTTLVGLMLLWTGMTATTAYAWGNPLRLAQDLAARAPNSPRALYGLGRMYIVYSDYKPDSVFTHMAYAPLERAMRLPHFSILPEQALIYMNARMHKPIKPVWWNSMIAKLKRRPAGVQDVSALVSLTQCQRDGECKLPQRRMIEAFLAALSHPHPSGRLLAVYGDYAWNVLDDRTLGTRMAKAAVHAAPNEPVYHVTLARMYAADGDMNQAREQIHALEAMNVGGRLDHDLSSLRALTTR